MLGDKESLVVINHPDNSTEWRVERPLFAASDILPCLILGGMAAYTLVVTKGMAWGPAAALGAAAAAAMLALQGWVEVYRESLTLTSGHAVRLEAQRRCGMGQNSRSMPLSRLSGVMIHEHTTPRRACVYYLALTLKSTSNRSSGGDNEDDIVQAELAFANLQPRLGLVKQVYEQLRPLLEAELQGKLKKAAQAEKQAGKDASRVSAAEPKKEK